MIGGFVNKFLIPKIFIIIKFINFRFQVISTKIEMSTFGKIHDSIKETNIKKEKCSMKSN